MHPDWPLETERLTLRPVAEGDFDALHTIYSNPDVVRYLYHEPRTPEGSRELLARKVAGWSVQAEGDWLSAAAIRDGEVVGEVLFHWVSEPHRTGEIGFSFDPRHQGKGYATESAHALTDWAFAQGFHRVIGRLEARNAASARVLQKLGMRLEAHFVDNEWVKGEWQSELV